MSHQYPKKIDELIINTVHICILRCNFTIHTCAAVRASPSRLTHLFPYVVTSIVPISVILWPAVVHALWAIIILVTDNTEFILYCRCCPIVCT